MTKITGFDTFDIRFPTSRTLAGSDAMNPAPDYSAAYVVIRTDAADPALSGHGFAFTIGRGNDVQLAAIRLLEPFLAGRDLDEVLADLGGLGRRLVSDSPLHWLGPSCGVMHMATGAVLNACWDLAARRAAKPLWLLLAEMSPQEMAARPQSVAAASLDPAAQPGRDRDPLLQLDPRALLDPRGLLQQPRGAHHQIPFVGGQFGIIGMQRKGVGGFHGQAIEEVHRLQHRRDLMVAVAPLPQHLEGQVHLGRGAEREPLASPWPLRQGSTRYHASRRSVNGSLEF